MTNINYQELLKPVFDFYPVEVQEVVLLDNSNGKTRWLVKTNQGEYCLKRQQIRPARMLFIAGAHYHLQEKNFPIANILLTKNGGLCVSAEDHAYIMVEEKSGVPFNYYHKDHLFEAMEFIGDLHKASKGYFPYKESKKRARVGKWHKLYQWKLQELEGNKLLAQTAVNDSFSVHFLQHVDELLERGKQSLKELDEGPYQHWVNEIKSGGGFCQQDFTFSRLSKLDDQPFLRELHSITIDLPSRDLRILLNKVMGKLGVWDTNLAVQMLKAYESANQLTEEQYKVLWADLRFPYSFCSISHKYYLNQKQSISDDQYVEALKNSMTVERSKQQFLDQFQSIYTEIKAGKGGRVDE
jgi:spore coat-associated protein S